MTFDDGCRWTWRDTLAFWSMIWVPVLLWALAVSAWHAIFSHEEFPWCRGA